MTSTISLARGSFVTASTGRQHVCTWRRHRYSTDARRPGKRFKSFVKHIDPDGEVYYTVANKEEGKEMPRKLRDDELFELSNLMIDLDAEGAKGVREFTAGDEKRHQDTWKYHPDLVAKSRVSHLVGAIDQSRKAAQYMALHQIHPMHIMDRDIMSLALRGLSGQTDTRRAPISRHHQVLQSQPSLNMSQGTQRSDFSTGRTLDLPEPLVITKFSQKGREDRNSLPVAATSTPETYDVDIPERMSIILQQLMHGGSPCNASDYIKSLKTYHGIPTSATRDCETFIRWMLLLQENNSLLKNQPKTPAILRHDVVRALAAVKRQPLSKSIISDIRRIMFQAINAGVDLRASRDEVEGGVDVALELHKQVVKALGKCSGNSGPHFEVLTFMNNLAERLPERDHHMDTVIFSLRLRAISGLGLIELATSQLGQGVTIKMWDSSVGILDAVAAALASWRLNLDKNSCLRVQDSQKPLLRLMTGFDEQDKQLSTSYRTLILDRRSYKSENAQEAQLSAFGNYVRLLGRLGAARTLWSEWRTARELAEELENQMAEEDSDKEGNCQIHYVKVFQEGLDNALKIANLSFEPSDDIDLKSCVGADITAMKTQSPITTPVDEITQSKLFSGMEQELFVQMMNLPLKEWLEQVRKASL